MANVLVKHWRLIALVIGVFVFIWVIYLMRSFVLPFAIGLILAYLMNPLVHWLEEKLPPRKKWAGFRRVISIFITFLLLLVIIGGFLYIIITAVIDASLALVENAPDIISEGLRSVQEWFEGLVENLPVEIQEDVNQEIIQAGISLGNSIRDFLLNSVSNIQSTFSTVLGFAVLPFFLFYLLKDSEKLKSGIRNALPEAVAEHGKNVVHIIERVLGRYIKAQLMLALIVGYFSFIGLLLLDVPFALALALLAGITELIPTLGPWIGGAAAVIVALALTPDKAVWVAVLYFVIQMTENNLLVPKIQSAYLGIHPAIMILLLVFGAFIAGIWGVLLIGPLTATLVALFNYVRDHYRAQQLLGDAEAGREF